MRVLVPAESDVPVAQAAGRFFYGTLLRSGVRIFEYLPAVLHAKTVVVDGSWALVGSANLDFRSFSLNFELGALVFDRAFATLLEERFTSDLAREPRGDARGGRAARLRRTRPARPRPPPRAAPLRIRSA